MNKEILSQNPTSVLIEGFVPELHINLFLLSFLLCIVFGQNLNCRDFIRSIRSDEIATRSPDSKKGGFWEFCL